MDRTPSHPSKRRRTEGSPTSGLRKPFSSPLLRKVPAVELKPPNPAPDKTDVSQLPSEGLAVKTRPSDSKLILSKRVLQNEIKAARNELQSVAQAKTVLVDRQREDLEELIKKWREIARTAADTAFDTFPPPQPESRNSDEVGRRASTESGEWTMNKMLQSLGIDPDLLQYDESSETWVDEAAGGSEAPKHKGGSN